MIGKERRQFTPSGFRRPFSKSDMFSGARVGSPATTPRSVAPLSEASIPAGAFQTPRWASVRANTPATAPQGTNVLTVLLSRGSGWRSLGKNRAAFLATSPTSGKLGSFTPWTAWSTVFQTRNGSTISTARRSTQ